MFSNEDILCFSLCSKSPNSLRAIHYVNICVCFCLACISTPQLNSMHVETNESISASHFRKQNPIYSNTSETALGMNMDIIMEYSHKRKYTEIDLCVIRCCATFHFQLEIYTRYFVVLVLQKSFIFE